MFSIIDCLMFYSPLDRKQVTSETFFAANHLSRHWGNKTYRRKTQKDATIRKKYRVGQKLWD